MLTLTSISAGIYDLIVALYERLLSDPALILWLSLMSLLMFVVSLLIVPWLVVRIPANYFSEPANQRSALVGNHPLLRFMFKIFRNVFAVVLVALGVLMIFLPGQGLLTLLLGVGIADFPGKHRLVLWLVRKESIHRPMNWLRRRANREPIVID